MFAAKDTEDLLLWLPVTCLAWYSMSLDLIQENLGVLLFGSEISAMLKIGAIHELLSSKNEVLGFIFNHYNDCMGLSWRGWGSDGYSSVIMGVPESGGKPFTLAMKRKPGNTGLLTHEAISPTGLAVV